MNIKEFAESIAEICRHSSVASGRPLRWTVIANPKAGGFTIRSRWKSHRAVLAAFAEEAGKQPPRHGGAEPSRTARELDIGDGSLGALGVVPTLRPAHAGEIVRALIDEAAASDLDAGAPGACTPAPFHLLVTAGGDGTSLEALTALFDLPPALRSSFAILRLPMGTGNDGADACELKDALALLARPSRIAYTRAVRLRTATPGKGPYLAFNVLSVGLDAFVVRMTNRMKGRLPGDSYKLWVDIAALFYDLIYPTAPMTVTATAGGVRGGVSSGVRGSQTFTEELLLLAFGASGNRTYGSNKRILPDGRNVCFVRQMPLLRKLALKGLFTTGAHALEPEVRLFDAERVELRYDRPLLAQMDGEDLQLEERDFPVVIELTEPAIPTLLPA